MPKLVVPQFDKLEPRSLFSGDLMGALDASPPELQDSVSVIYENAETGTKVTDLDAFDAESSQLYYFIEAGNEDGAFRIDHYTGEIFVSDNTNLDYETIQQRDLLVKVYDALPVVDFDDMGATGTSVPDSLALTDWFSSNGDIDSLSTSGDWLSNGTYNAGTLEGSNRAVGMYTAASGDLRYLTAQVYVDSSGTLDLSLDVFIACARLDELGRYWGGVGVSIDGAAETLSATLLQENSVGLQWYDSDTAVDKAHLSGTFTGLSEGYHTLKFDFRDGYATPDGLHQENRKRLLVALDNIQVGPAAETDTATATIQLEDVNEYAPAMVDGDRHFTVQRGQTTGSEVLDVSATDRDGSAVLTYSIVGGNYGGAFGIDSQTGTIYIADGSAVGLQTSYSLTVQASDGTFSAVTTVTGEVLVAPTVTEPTSESVSTSTESSTTEADVEEDATIYGAETDTSETEDTSSTTFSETEDAEAATEEDAPTSEADQTEEVSSTDSAESETDAETESESDTDRELTEEVATDTETDTATDTEAESENGEEVAETEDSEAQGDSEAKVARETAEEEEVPGEEEQEHLAQTEEVDPDQVKAAEATGATQLAQIAAAKRRETRKRRSAASIARTRAQRIGTDASVGKTAPAPGRTVAMARPIKKSVWSPTRRKTAPVTSSVDWTQIKTLSTQKPIDVLAETPALTEKLDSLKEQMDKQYSSEVKTTTVAVGTVTGVTAFASAGYLFWCLRGGSLMASAITSFPLWRWFDPLPIVEFHEKENTRNNRHTDDDEDSLLLSLVE